MDKKEMEDQVIKSYQSDEKMMILIYAQWCINNDFDPAALYAKAYPNQIHNPVLAEAMELTVSKKESEEISTHTVLEVLQLFGNDDLAFIVQNETDNKSAEPGK